MASIKVTPSELRTSSSKFKNNANQTSSMISQLNNEVNRLTSAWEGAAHNAFFNRYHELQPKMKEFVDVLQHISTQLDSVARQMEETDRQIASQMNR